MHIAYSFLSLLMAMAMVQAQSNSSSAADTTTTVSPTLTQTSDTSSSTTTTTTTTTTYSPTPTTDITTTIITTTTSDTTIVIPTTIIIPTSQSTESSIISTPTTTAFSIYPNAPPFVRPTDPNSKSIAPSTSTKFLFPTVGLGSPSSPSSSSSSSSNRVPIIVGSLVGIAALAIVVTTSVVCYRRRRHSDLELTLDTINGFSTPPLKSMKADQQGYLANITPTTSGGGYDDGYDYEMHSNSDYPRLQEYSGGRLEPTGPYMTATSMSRNHLGFDQNLPRSVYNRPGGDNPTSAGYYSDLDVYSNGIWDQSSHQNQRWTPTPENMYYSDVDQQHNSYIASAQPPVQNQGVPDSPILPSPTFRESGFFGRDSDLFGQNNDLFGQNNGQINNPPPGALLPNSDAPSQLPARTSRDGINNYANEYANNQNMSLRNLRYPE